MNIRIEQVKEKEQKSRMFFMLIPINIINIIGNSAINVLGK